MKFLLENACAILAADPGVGKTSCTYGAFKVLRAKGLAKKMLVVAPLKPCYLVWPAEQEKWQDFYDLKVQVLHGETRDAALIKDADVCVINPDGLDWLVGAKRTKSAKTKRVSVTVDRKRFKSFGFDTLVIDELTRFKHHQSGRFKVLKEVHDTFGRRWGLTGSLTANGLLDLFGQCLMIDGGRSFGAYITHFRTQYFTPGKDGFSWVLQPDGGERIQKRVAPLVMRIAATGLPDLVEVVRKFDLPGTARRVYDELEEDMIAELEGKTVVAANAGVLSGKCRQVACGGLYLAPETVDVLGKLARKAERQWVDLHDEKTDLVESLVEELQGEPLLVAYEFNHDLARLRKRFPDAPFIGGGVAAGDLKAIEKRWNDGSTPLLFGHPSTIAHGLNLQRAGRHVCWHSLTWDYELYDQLIRRLRRRGSGASQIFVHHLVAKQTVDELMMRTIKAKAKGQNSFYEALVELAKGRRGRK